MKPYIVFISIFITLPTALALNYNQYKEAMRNTSLEEITQKAESGDVENQELLAYYHKNKDDYKQAIIWFLKAEENGSSYASYAIYNMYKYKVHPASKEISDEEREELSLKYLKKSAEAGYTRAFSDLAHYYQYGEQKDDALALKWHEKSAQRGEIYSMWQLADIYKRGALRDVQKQVYWLHEAAKNRHSYSMMLLGDVYFKGEIVDKDLDKAFYWYNKSYEQFLIDKKEKAKQHSCIRILGSEYSGAPLRQLGECYEFGYGTQINLEKAAYFYLLNKNEMMAYFKIKNRESAARCYSKISPPKLELAFECLKEATEIKEKSLGGRDLRKSYHDLAIFYTTGTCTEKDMNKAINLYEKSEWDKSKFILAYIYARGLDTEQNLDKALSYMKKCTHLNKEDFYLEDISFAGKNPLINTIEIINYLKEFAKENTKGQEILKVFHSIRGDLKNHLNQE